MAIVIVAGVLVLGSTAWADGTKRVIYVQDDTSEDFDPGYRYANLLAANWYLQNPKPKDQFVREAQGGTLLAAWKKLNHGDELVIIAHGSIGGIDMDGSHRRGFRDSANPDSNGTNVECGDPPYALQKRELNDIKIRLLSCYGGRDPDPDNESKQSVIATLAALITGTGLTYTAHNNEGISGIEINIKPGSDAQVQSTVDCLLAAAKAAGFTPDPASEPWYSVLTRWLQSMTYPDAQNAVNGAIEACGKEGTNLVGANVTYTEPQDAPREREAPRSAEPSGIHELRPCANCDPSATCLGDINGDDVVDVSDLLALLSAWGPCANPNNCPADLNADGVVDVSDLLVLLSAWGPCPEPPTPTGACCFVDGTCMPNLPNSDCDAIGGKYGGDFSACEDCPSPAGDSCFGWCGTHAPDGCWCDETCCDFVDCCEDKLTACGGCTP